MGMQRQMVRLLLQEHQYKPITGNVLLIGRQTVPLTIEQTKDLIRMEGVPCRDEAQPRIDATTRSGKEHGFIADVSVFDLFTTATVRALDISDYEGAEIVQDLNRPLPSDLEGQFDFIYNGSCLDNIFDPVTSLRSMTQLLRPGGRIVHIEHGTHLHGPYLKYSPDWFFDYYLLNDFEDCKSYLAVFHDFDGPWAIYQWNPVVDGKLEWSARPPKGDFLVLTIAEKREGSTADRSPVQAQYRHGAEKSVYTTGALRFARSGRPALKGEPGDRNVGRPKTRGKRIELLFTAFGRQVAGTQAKRSRVHPSYRFCGYFG